MELIPFLWYVHDIFHLCRIIFFPEIDCEVYDSDVIMIMDFGRNVTKPSKRRTRVIAKCPSSNRLTNVKLMMCDSLLRLK